MVKKLIAILNIRSVIQNKKGKLLNKTFMFTGKLSSISRAEAKSLTEENSGKILSNVSKKLDYLVTGEKPTVKKVKQAKELNIKVIDQKEYENLSKLPSLDEIRAKLTAYLIAPHQQLVHILNAAGTELVGILDNYSKK